MSNKFLLAAALSLAGFSIAPDTTAQKPENQRHPGESYTDYHARLFDSWESKPRSTEQLAQQSNESAQPKAAVSARVEPEKFNSYGNMFAGMLLRNPELVHAIADRVSKPSVSDISINSTDRDHVSIIRFKISAGTSFPAEDPILVTVVQYSSLMGLGIPASYKWEISDPYGGGRGVSMD